MNDADRVRYKEFPDVVLRNILSHVPKDNFLNVRLVNRQWNQISYDVSLWRKVDLLRPLDSEQILKLMNELNVVRPHLGANVREMTITGFHTVPIVDEPYNPRIIQHDPSLDSRSRYEGVRNPWHPMRNEPRTFTLWILRRIAFTCPNLEKLVIRNCWLDLENDTYSYLQPTLKTLEFEGCRLPDNSDNWMGQVSAQYVGHENLKTLKFERCFAVDHDFRRYLRVCPAIRNFSEKGSILHYFGWSSSIEQSPYYSPATSWGQMKSLDLSGIGKIVKLVHERVLSAPECTVTHLYLERCPILPRPVYEHLKIEFLSVAGYRPSTDVGNAFDDVDAWASIPTLRDMNASGCDLTQDQRDELVRKHPNVIFNVNVEFRESPRIYF